MAVNLNAPEPGSLHPVGGIEIGVAQAGVRKPGRDDLALMRLAEDATVAAVFTRNRFCAAPVVIAREHLGSGAAPRALVINTGNANAGTGAGGLAAARATCDAVAALLGIEARQVLPFSTGVILEPLPAERITAALPACIQALRADAWERAAAAIMTTDTVPKGVSRQLRIGPATVNVTGIAKGAGMIRPDMGTMLAFVATDAWVEPAMLERWMREIADTSFNRITVDGDTSTNDAFLIIATGSSGVRIGGEHDGGAHDLKAALTEVARTLAQAIVRDGEGATKFIAVHVAQAADDAEATAVAYAIAHSPLVKTAFYASDPNLGRILAAIGHAGITDLDVSRIELHLGDVHVATRGGRHPGYREEDGQRVLARSEIDVTVLLARGHARTTVWTCDLSHQYVSINADYRS